MISIALNNIFLPFMTWAIALFPSVNYDFSLPVGQALLWLNQFREMSPSFFSAIFKQLYIANVIFIALLSYLFVFKFIPFVKKAL